MLGREGKYFIFWLKILEKLVIQCNDVQWADHFYKFLHGWSFHGYITFPWTIPGYTFVMRGIFLVGLKEERHRFLIYGQM